MLMADRGNADGPLMTCVRRAALGISLCASVLFAAIGTSAAAPGDPVVTFGDGGLVVRTFGTDDGRFEAAAVTPDGRIVVVGDANSTPAVRSSLVVRYAADGTMDPAFGNGGAVLTSTHPDSTAAKAVVALPNGDLVVGGDHGNFVGMYLARYDVDGALDTSFGDDGIVVRSTGFVGLNELNALVRQPDGALVAGGEIFPGFGLVRFHEGGDVDTSFGANGEVRTEVGERSSIDALVALSDGRILAAGTGRTGDQSAIALARYTSDGALDPTFGDAGIVRLRPLGRNALLSDMAVQPDGTIVVTGAIHRLEDGNDRLVMRLLADGSVDSSFGAQGVYTEAEPFSRAVSAVLLEPDGKIVLTSFRKCIRLEASGQRDDSFGRNGEAVVDVDTRDLLRLPNGSILLVGAYRGGDGFPTALALLESGLSVQPPAGSLERPGEGSYQGGVGDFDGWTCGAGDVVVVVDEVWFVRMATGRERVETVDLCGDTDNGFGLTVSWSLFGHGEHEAVVFAEGLEVDRSLFYVFSIADLWSRRGEFGEEERRTAFGQLNTELPQALAAFFE